MVVTGDGEWAAGAKSRGDGWQLHCHLEFPAREAK